MIIMPQEARVTDASNHDPSPESLERAATELFEAAKQSPKNQTPPSILFRPSNTTPEIILQAEPISDIDDPVQGDLGYYDEEPDDVYMWDGGEWIYLGVTDA